MLDRSLNQQSNPAVILRHRIVKPRLDDELTALDCFRCRRPRAWRDANVDRRTRRGTLVLARRTASRSLATRRELEHSSNQVCSWQSPMESLRLFRRRRSLLMESGTGQSCCTTSGKCSCNSCKCRLCSLIFKLVIVGLLTCIASSLWEIDKSIGRMTPTAAAKP